MQIQDFRRSYDVSQLDTQDLDADPVEQFAKWFQECQEAPSADWFEPNAMTLATADPTGQVTARIVLLKKFSAEGFCFFTNYQSEKGRQLEANPRASLMFYWPHVERQIRIDGTVERTEDALSDHYFHSRPRGSQISAAISRQSQPVNNRAELEQLAQELDAKYAGQEIPRPDFWGGYQLQPNRIEFWQGRPNRLHDRFVYTRELGQQWQVQRLAP